jgi:Restriction endonuclease
MTNQPTQQRIRELRAMPYDEYLKTPEWALKRDQALERDGHCCRACNTRENLHVHHRTYMRRGNENLDDLTTFCQSCHEHFHRKMSQAEIMGRTYEAPREYEDPAVLRKKQAQKWEDYLLGLLIQNPGLCPHVIGILPDSDFADPDTQEIYRIFKSVYQRDIFFTPQSFEQSVPSALLPVVARVTSNIDIESKDEAQLAKEAIQCIVRLKRMHLQQANEELQILIREAAVAGDRVTEQELRQKALVNRKLLHTLYTSTNLQS